MRRTPIPSIEGSQWPEYMLGGATRAPRGWNFYLSDESDDYGPMTLTAVDEGGQARAYHRHGYLPREVTKSINFTGWAMFASGIAVCLVASLLLSCTFVVESEHMGTDTGTAPAAVPNGTTGTSSTGTGSTNSTTAIDGDPECPPDTPETPETPKTPAESDHPTETPGESDSDTGIDGEWSDPLDDACVLECYAIEIDLLSPLCEAIPNESRCIPAIVDAATMRCVEICEWSCR